MIIETEFKIGQLVWLMSDNKAVFGKVELLRATVYYTDEDDIPDIRINYTVKIGNNASSYSELMLFQDKHALLSSL